MREYGPLVVCQGLEEEEAAFSFQLSPLSNPVNGFSLLQKGDVDYLAFTNGCRKRHEKERGTSCLTICRLMY